MLISSRCLVSCLDGRPLQALVSQKDLERDGLPCFPWVSPAHRARERCWDGRQNGKCPSSLGGRALWFVPGGHSRPPCDLPPFGVQRQTPGVRFHRKPEAPSAEVRLEAPGPASLALPGMCHWCTCQHPIPASWVRVQWALSSVWCCRVLT